MPLPAIFAGGLGALGPLGTSDVIAIGGYALGTGVVLATQVQTNVVDISEITFTATASDALFVGDRVNFLATCRVSFGDTWSGGSVSVALFETVGSGASTLLRMKTRSQETNPQTFQLEADVVGKLHDVEAEYFVAVEVTGEDDVRGPFDYTVTRTRYSTPIKLIFRRPYEMAVLKSTPEEKVHGQQDNFQASAINRGQFDVRLGLLWRTQNGVIQASRPRVSVGTTALTSVDTFSVRGEHALALHREFPVQVYTTDLFVSFAYMEIRYPPRPSRDPLDPPEPPVDEVWTDRPVPLQVVPQYSTTCKVPQGTELGAARVDPEAFPALLRPELFDRRFAMRLKGADGQAVAFVATVTDTAGNSVAVESDTRGIALVNGAFGGDLAYFVAEPRSSFYDRVSGAFLFDDAEALIRSYAFPVAAGPTIAGVVVSPELGSIAGASVVLRAAGGAELSRVETRAGGTFAIPASRGIFSPGQPFLDVSLPPSFDIHWETLRLSIPLSAERLERGEAVVVSPKLASSAGPGPVRVTGTLGIRNEPAGSSVPVRGGRVSLLALSGEVAGKATSGDKGTWSVEVPPDRYLLSVVLPGGRRDADALQPIDIRAARTDIDLVFRIPSPVIDESAPNRVRVLLPADLGCGHVALVAGDRVVATMSVDETGFIDVPRRVLLEKAVTSVAAMADGVVGRRARLKVTPAVTRA